MQWLFIAEAPPNDHERFFYFENVSTRDSLYLTLMRALYPTAYGSLDALALRARKPEALARFRSDGGFLEDAATQPISGTSTEKKRALQRALPALLERLEVLRADEPKVVLISATVYGVCLEALKAANWNVLNSEMLPFPGSGQQARFRAILAPLLAQHGWPR